MKYPIGIQDFRTLREGGYIYVDKTQHIHRLLTAGKYYFFSRPRRFGKSLTVATMNELYSGSRELFDGLWVQEHWDFKAMRRPVIWLQFARLDYQMKGLYRAILEELVRIGRTLGVDLPEATLKDTFSELLRRLSGQGRVVLLIDEYDKPIIDYLDDLPRAEENRELLKQFYSVLKDSDPYLELVFVTGVSAFSKVSIFSDLNNLQNVSLTPGTNTLVGVTETELDRYFNASLSGVDRDHLRQWYNGYSWTGEETVYNPFSILNFMTNRQYQNYWFETGTPTFLVKAMKDKQLYDIEGVQSFQSDLISFNVDRLNPVAILFQTGYLTVKRYDAEDMLYVLGYPNMEVQQSLEENLLKAYQRDAFGNPRTRVISLRKALDRKDVEAAVDIINATLAGVPYDLWQSDNEHTFHALVHLTFSLLGVYVRSEVHTARGRCDALVQTEDYVYAFEFKRDATARRALEQIAARGYLTPFADDPRERIAVGISFDSATRQVGDWATITLA